MSDQKGIYMYIQPIIPTATSLKATSINLCTGNPQTTQTWLAPVVDNWQYIVDTGYMNFTAILIVLEGYGNHISSNQ